jgi:uncharacterized protein (DUF2267 family)
MKLEEILSRVREMVGLENNEEAERLVRAVFGTLGERVYRTEERHLAAQLPKELKNAFYEYQSKESGRAALGNYPLEEFYNRVKARAKLRSFQETQRQTKIVMAVLKEAVSQGEIEDIQREMPEEFRHLFKTQNLEVARSEIPAPEIPLSSEIIEEYHIRPTQDRKWMVQKGENGQVLGIFDHKEPAIAHADDIADGNRGDILVIYNIDGSISKRQEPATREDLWKEVVEKD